MKTVVKFPVAVRGGYFASDPAQQEREGVRSGHVERRLAAILMADVAGYCRLVGADEQGTLARWRAHWDELIGPKIGMHQGRVVRINGDGILLEFASVVNAVLCAVAIQRAMAKRNAAIAARPHAFKNRARENPGAGRLLISEWAVQSRGSSGSTDAASATTTRLPRTAKMGGTIEGLHCHQALGVFPGLEV